MEKTSMEMIMAIKNQLKAGFGIEGKSVEQIRDEEKATAARIPMLSEIMTEKTMVAGFPAEWIIPDSVSKDSKKMILYYHGGGFISGSCESHRDLLSRISKASGVKVLIVEYRLAPEHKYPAANEDCLHIYRWLLENGFQAQNIIMGGESTGAYLVLMTLLALRDAREVLPKAAFLLSPHTDFLYYDGESYESRRKLDPMSSLDGCRMCADRYFPDYMKEQSILSPLNENLEGLPSLFVQVGDHEVILSDSVRLYENARKAGVDATLEVWDNMWHIFRFMAYMLPEGVQAIESVGRFVKGQFGIG